MENGGHPGVRNLLARFENQQANTSSPPSRGRSPVGSDTSGTPRPLSKVRASFIAVDGAVQSSPVAGLRRSASTRSDSPAAPARVRSFHSDELEGSLKSPLATSPPSNGVSSAVKPTEQVSSQAAVTQPLQSSNAQAKQPPPAPKEDRPTPATSAKATSVAPKSKAASAPASKPAPATKTNAPTASQTSTKPDASARTRPVKPAAGSSAKQLAPKASRTSLNPATKPTTTRPARASMPTSGATKPTAPSTTRTARLPASATTPTLSSVSKTGTTGQTRKPSTVKPTTRAHNPAVAAPRKTTHARPTTTERPSSRVSERSTKPVDEGFLARMMRPTASSASKVHDKVDVKSPGSKGSRTAKKVVSKSASRSVAQSSAASAKSKTESAEARSRDTSTHEGAPARASAPVENLEGTAEWVQQHAIPSVPEEDTTAPEEAQDSTVVDVNHDISEEAPATPEESKESVVSEEPQEPKTLVQTEESAQKVAEESTEPASEATPSKPEVAEVVPEARPESSTEKTPEETVPKTEELTNGVEKLALA